MHDAKEATLGNDGGDDIDRRLGGDCRRRPSGGTATTGMTTPRGTEASSGATTATSTTAVGSGGLPLMRRRPRCLLGRYRLPIRYQVHS